MKARDLEKTTKYAQKSRVSTIFRGIKEQQYSLLKNEQDLNENQKLS
jgi:hypothetical protein